MSGRVSLSVQRIISAELENARRLHPTWPANQVKRVAIVAGEAGEALKEAIKLDEGKGSESKIAEEMAQVAATAIRWLECFYEGREPHMKWPSEFEGKHQGDD